MKFKPHPCGIGPHSRSLLGLVCIAALSLLSFKNYFQQQMAVFRGGKGQLSVANGPLSSYPHSVKFTIPGNGTGSKDIVEYEDDVKTKTFIRGISASTATPGIYQYNLMCDRQKYKLEIHKETDQPYIKLSFNYDIAKNYYQNYIKWPLLSN